MNKILVFLAIMVFSSLTFAQSQPTDCKTGIERCGPQVKPPSCPPGQHWSNKKTGYARCESDTPPPPGCTNGWTNYPICGPVSPPPPPPPGCTNGWTNYPICGPVSPPPPPPVEPCPSVKNIPSMPGAYPYLYYKPAGEVKMMCAYGPTYSDSSGTGFKDIYDASIAQGFKCDPFIVHDAFGAGTGWEVYWTCEAR